MREVTLRTRAVPLRHPIAKRPFTRYLGDVGGEAPPVEGYPMAGLSGRWGYRLAAASLVLAGVLGAAPATPAASGQVVATATVPPTAVAPVTAPAPMATGVPAPTVPANTSATVAHVGTATATHRPAPTASVTSVGSSTAVPTTATLTPVRTSTASGTAVATPLANLLPSGVATRGCDDKKYVILLAGYGTESGMVDDTFYYIKSDIQDKYCPKHIKNFSYNYPNESYVEDDTFKGFPKQSNSSLEKMLDDIRPGEQDTQVALIGHSLGGAVAWYYVSDPEHVNTHVNKISHVITLDSPIRGEDWLAGKKRFAFTGALYLDELPSFLDAERWGLSPTALWLANKNKDEERTNKENLDTLKKLEQKMVIYNIGSKNDWVVEGVNSVIWDDFKKENLNSTSLMVSLGNAVTNVFSAFIKLSGEVVGGWLAASLLVKDSATCFVEWAYRECNISKDLSVLLNQLDRNKVIEAIWKICVPPSIGKLKVGTWCVGHNRVLHDAKVREAIKLQLSKVPPQSGGGSQSTPTRNPIAVSPGHDAAAFVRDVTFPKDTAVTAGQSIRKTWRLKNSGTSTWDGYKLVFDSGDQMRGASPTLVARASPGAEIDVTVEMTAPSATGPRGNWKLVNRDGVLVPGGNVWIQVNVVGSKQAGGGSGGSTGTGKITLFEISPGSPTDAQRAHATCRATWFPDFRSMRVRIGDQVQEMTNLRTFAGQVEIGADFDVGSLPRATYAATCEVSSKSAPDWANAERRVISYTLTGTAAPRVSAPSRPSLKSPHDWYMKDNSGSAASFQLCVNGSTAAGGGTVQYFFQVSNTFGNPVAESGWVTGTCWNTPSLGSSGDSPGSYQWKAKAGVGNGAATSDWSQETWRFSVASGDVKISTWYIREVDQDQLRVCVIGSYGGIQGPEGIGYINLKGDGSESGEWSRLGGGVLDSSPYCKDKAAHEVAWGFTISPRAYVEGTHAIKITVTKKDSGHQASTTASWTAGYLRPSNFDPVSPSSREFSATSWNTTTIDFAWTRPMRDDQGYDLRVGTNENVWSDPAPLVNVALPPGTLSYQHAFTQDHPRLYWNVRAKNRAGTWDFWQTLSFVIDRVPPTCRVATLPSVSAENVFQVRWSGNDNSSGVREFSVQVRDGRGDWMPWQSDVPATKIVELFTGQSGHDYAFRCQATDQAGNTSQYPAAADTTLRIDPASGPPVSWWNDAYAQKRNFTISNNMANVNIPVDYPVKVRFDTASSPTSAEIYDGSLSSPKCNDVRIVHNDTTELNRIMLSCTSTLIEIQFRTQVAIPAASANVAAHQLYYGNATPASPKDDPHRIWFPEKEADTVALYWFQEGKGATAVDASGHGRNCSITSDVQWVPGLIGSSLFFDGHRTSEQRALRCTPPSLTSFTVDFWYMPIDDYSSHIAGVTGEGHANSWRIENANKYIILKVWPCWCDEVKAMSRDSFPEGEWAHVAIAFDGMNEVTFYKNGILDSKSTLSRSGIVPSSDVLEIGSSGNTRKVTANIGAFRISSGVKTSFPHASFAAITTQPTVQAGDRVTPPSSALPMLVVTSLTTEATADGGSLVQAQVHNLGGASTRSGFFIDLYADHQPTGPGDTAGSLNFWVASPIDAGQAITVNTVIANPSSVGGSAVRPAAPGERAVRALAASETSSKVYVQADSTGAVTQIDRSGTISAPATLCFARADAYEGTDSQASAQALAVGQSLTRNFHAPGDQDWVKFAGQAGATYHLRTLNLGAAADTFLSLFGADGATLLATNDDDGSSLASSVQWTVPSDGTYYVMAQQWNPNSGGCGTTYDVSVSLASTTSTPTTSYTLAVNPGWNLVSLAIQPSASLTAASFCTAANAGAPGAVTEVVRYVAGGWDSHRCAIAVNDFGIAIGTGYFVKATSPTTFNYAGTEVAQSPALSLVDGWNLVGLPRTTGLASGIAAAIDGAAGASRAAREVVRWSAGAWEGHVAGIPVNAFNIESGRGYAIRTDRALTWQPGATVASLQVAQALPGTASPTATPSRAPSATPSATATALPTATPSGSASASPTLTATPTASPTPTVPPAVVATVTAAASPTATATPTPLVSAPSASTVTVGTPSATVPSSATPTRTVEATPVRPNAG